MNNSSAFHRYKEIILGVIMLAFSVFYLYYAAGIKTRSTVSVSAKLIPELLGIAVFVLGCVQLAQGIRYLRRIRVQDGEAGSTPVFMNSDERRDLLPIMLTFVLIVAYAAVFEWLGFIVSSSLCMFFQIMLLAPAGKRKPVLFAVISVVVAFGVYVAFRKGLDLSLPPGILEGVFV